MYVYVYIKIYFSFTEAKAKILGPADLYVKTGSLLSLTCILSQGPHDLGTMFWYKGKFNQDKSILK